MNYRLRIYLFSSEQASAFAPVQIESGCCIAGYVAWARETVRISDMSMVKIKKLILIFH